VEGMLLSSNLLSIGRLPEFAAGNTSFRKCWYRNSAVRRASAQGARSLRYSDVSHVPETGPIGPMGPTSSRMPQDGSCWGWAWAGSQMGRRDRPTKPAHLRQTQRETEAPGWKTNIGLV